MKILLVLILGISVPALAGDVEFEAVSTCYLVPVDIYGLERFTIIINEDDEPLVIPQRPLVTFSRDSVRRNADRLIERGECQKARFLN